jgi:hypothetical protein
MRLLIAILALAAMPQVTTRRSFGPGVCGPIDPVYNRGATETGGQVFPAGPSEIGKMATMMAESSRNDAVMILWAGGTASNATRAFSVPVDSTVKRVTFSATFDGTGGSVTIATPDGKAIELGPRVEETVLNCGRILTVDTPATGVWSVNLQPTNQFWFVVHGRSDVDLLGAEFVRPGGRPAHEGWFRIQGQPIAGRPATLRVNVSDLEPETPQFVLFSAEGQLLHRVELARVGPDEYVGPIELPAVPFRVAVTGVDSGGASYQRFHKGLFRAELVEVVPTSDEATVQAGQETAVAFTIRNSGPRARYRIVAVYGGQVVTRVDPDVVEIDQDTEQRILVWLRVADSAAAGSSTDLRVTATADGPRPSWNSAAQKITIAQ